MFLIILIIFIYFSLTLTTSELNKNQQINEDNIAETIINFGAKKCNIAYECWSTEPISEDGRPLFYGIIKRLEINGGYRNGKGKCRCKEGRCMFYSLSARIFYECQEL